jgi:RNA polymerase sigma factor (sigma-70 family)
MEVELMPIDGPAIGDMASIIADRELLDAALKRLRPKARAVMVLHYYLGMPLPDVASTLGIPIGTAKSRHHRALDEMRSSIRADLVPSQASVAGGQFA